MHIILLFVYFYCVVVVVVVVIVVVVVVDVVVAVIVAVVVVKLILLQFTASKYHILCSAQKAIHILPVYLVCISCLEFVCFCLVQSRHV